MSPKDKSAIVRDLRSNPIDLPAEWGGPQRIPEGHRLTRAGVFRRKAQESTRLSGPVWLAAQTQEAHGGIFGIVLRWIDLQGHKGEAAFPRDILHETGRTLVQQLARKGLEITPGMEQVLTRYLGSFDVDAAPWWTSASRTGWLGAAKDLAFVCPDQIIPRAHAGSIVFQPEEHSPTAATMRAQGSLDGWRTHVGKCLDGNPFLLFTACAALAAPLLRPAHLDSGGFHLYGRSSRGKTTAAQVAASVWGCGADPADAPADAYTLRWNATANGLEALAAAHNDLPFVLDEIHTCGAKDFAQVIYNLAGGQGKSTLNRERGLRAPRTWSTLLLSTGEVSSRSKIEEDGQTARAGQLLRLVDIPTGEAIIVEACGLLPDAFVRALKSACAEHFGTAGPAFLEHLIARYSTMESLTAVVQDRLKGYEQTLGTALPAEPTPEHRRVLRRFALVAVAGVLAIEGGVLPSAQEDIESALRAVIRAWVADGAHLSDALRGVQAVQAFLLRHGSARFRDSQSDQATASAVVRDLAGYRDSDRQLYLFTLEGFKEACHDHDPVEVGRELKKRGLLFMNEGDRLVSRHAIAINGADQRLRLYAVKAAILEHDFAAFAKTSGTDGTAGQTA